MENNEKEKNLLVEKILKLVEKFPVSEKKTIFWRCLYRIKKKDSKVNPVINKKAKKKKTPAKK